MQARSDKSQSATLTRPCAATLASLLFIACSNGESSKDAAETPTIIANQALSAQPPQPAGSGLQPNGFNRSRVNRMPETDEILVQFADDQAASAATTVLRKHGSKSMRRLRSARRDSPLRRMSVAKVADGSSVDSVLARLRSDPNVRHAEPNYLRQALETPNDSRFSEQWALGNTGQHPARGPLPGLPGADIAWSAAADAVATHGGFTRDVVVAVIDSGIDYSHPDLIDAMWRNAGEIEGNGIDDDHNGYVDDAIGYDFVDDTPNPMDQKTSSHGTHVAGIIGAVARNARGIAGVGARVRLMALRVLGNNGGTVADIAEAIQYATDNGARIINASLGSDGRSLTEEQAIAEAISRGVLFVAAAGNDYRNTELVPEFPANFGLDGLLSVAATDRRDRMTEFSNWGRKAVHLAAPGDEIISTVRYTGYDYLSGTSMAAPHVSGAGAALLALGHDLSPSDLSRRLVQAAKPVPYLGCRTISGGRLDLEALLQSAIASDRTAPSRIQDLSAYAVGSDAAMLRFTAPGGDGSVGRAFAYEVRTATGTDWPGFAAATPHCITNRPQTFGETERVALNELDAAVAYLVQVKARDAAGNESLSNVATLKTNAADPLAWSDDVEAGSGAWQSATVGGSWSIAACSGARTGHCWLDSASGDYANNAQNALVTPSIDLRSAARAKLTFLHHYRFESGMDFGTVEVSRDGRTWRNRYRVSDRSLDWSTAEIDLGAAVGAIVRLRFMVQTDQYTVSDGWALDDVRISYVESSLFDEVALTDDFAAAAGWTTNGTWAVQSGVLSDSPLSNYSSGQISSAALARPMDFSSVERAQLRFDLAVELEDGADHLLAEVSSDGQLWNELGRFTGQLPSHPESLNLDAYAGFPKVWLRFVLATDGTTTADGVSIDNLRVDVRRAMRCGDRRVEGTEQCDLGASNGTPGACCLVDCVFAPAGSSCREAVGSCDVPEVCSGADAACPKDVVASIGQTCRAASGACDLEEQCTGASPYCPADSMKAAGSECRSATRPCDKAELCDGVSPACPADAASAAGTPCRVAAGSCDLPESCDGASMECPTDILAPAGLRCREASGSCDVPESCVGDSPLCPDDQVAVAGTECRRAIGLCDQAEHCDGAGSACPPDLHASVGTLCRSSSCANGVEITAARCDAAGLCPTEVRRECAPFVCSVDACADRCVSRADCAVGSQCSDGTCVPTLKPGTRCTNGENCATGLCVDGVCCDRACEGACEACNVTGSVGICTAVSGAARGTRSCAGTCVQGVCSSTPSSANGGAANSTGPVAAAGATGDRGDQGARGGAGNSLIDASTEVTATSRPGESSSSTSIPSSTDDASAESNEGSKGCTCTTTASRAREPHNLASLVLLLAMGWRTRQRRASHR